MVDPFEVTPDEIVDLDGTQLQRLVNRLLEIEVSQVGLPAGVLVTSDRIFDPDGGVDARIDASDFAGSEFLPSGASIWQSKAGKRSPNYGEELNKEQVLTAIYEGCIYVAVLGRELNDLQRAAEQRKLRAVLEHTAPGASFTLLSASHIAKWATKYPAVWHLLGRPSRPLWGVHDFLKQQELHDVEYCWSVPTESLRDAVRSQILQTASARPLRISGRTGVGKSRLTLETFAEPSSTAAFVPFADDLSVEVLSWIRDRPGLSMTLVVDECSLSDAERFQTYVSSAKGTLRLVTIGTDAPADRLNHLEVGPMTDDVIRDVVVRTHSQISLEQREWIVDKARGFVKLARRLAELARRAGIDLTGLDVPGLLGEMFSPEERDALTVVALLSHVGWEDEHEVEGQALSDHMGMPWPVCRRVIRSLEQRGYVGRTGRYRYVTPELLAIWFAAEEWSANRTGLLGIFSQAHPGMADRMSNRLRQMPHVDDVADLAKEVLGAEGPFRTLAVLNDPRNARLFGDFSRIAPEAAVSALERAFDQPDAPKLQSLGIGRREIVWTLERLVAHRNLFPAAARLLLRLAEAENEHFANNATGVFQSLFSPTGRATAATGDERLELLEEVITSGEDGELLIAVGAFKGIFDVHGGFGVSADPGGSPPPPAWAPESWEERTRYCRQAFLLLLDLLGHGSSAIRGPAESTILEQFRSLFWLGLGQEALDLAGRSDISENLQRRLVINAEDVITYDHDKPFMTDALLDGLRKLGKTIHVDPLRERLHLRLGSWNHDLRRALKNSSESFFDAEAREMKELVAELLLEPAILREEFGWIASEEAVKGQQFIGYLGEFDRQRDWLAPILDASLARNRPDLISSYVFGLARSSSNDEVESLLDEWATDQDFRWLVPHITSSLGLSDRRMVRLLELVASGLDPQSLVYLMWTQVESALDIQTLGKILRIMVNAGAAPRSAAWTILSKYVEDRSEGTGSLEPFRIQLLWELAGNPEFIGEFVDGHATYVWSECVKPLVEADPPRLVAAIVSAVQSERERLYEGTYVRQTLEACFRADPVGAWAAYADAISNVTLGNWMLTNWGAETGVTELVGVDNLKHWIEESDDGNGHRVDLVATLTTVDTELTPVIRWIVIEHGGSEEVLGKLMSEHGVRVFMGGMATAEQPRLEAARKWVEDEHPAIRKWARRVVQDLEQRIERYRIEDEESELRH